MKHFGDITKLSGYTLPIVDVITGGSPCQDLSVAGKRAGIKHSELGDEETTRSGLFMDQIRIVKEMRERDGLENGRPAHLCRPRFMVWENVGGAFSSGIPKGADFQAVLYEIARIVCKEAPVVPIPKDGWPKAGCISGVGDSGCTFSIAWRVHDAQHWGVPQRRKRIAVVCDFGGLSASEILFERQGMSGYSEPRGETRETAAGATGDGAESASISFQERAGKPGGGKGLLIQNERVGALSTLNIQSVLQSASGVVSKGNGEAFLTGEKTSSLTIGGGQAGQGYPCVLQSESMGVDLYNQTTTGGVSKSLNSAATDSDHIPCVMQSASAGAETYPIEGNGARPSHKGPGFGNANDPSFTLNSIERHGVAYGIDQQGGKGGANFAEDVCPSILSDSHGTPHAVCYDARGNMGDVMHSSNLYDAYQHHGYRESDTCGTLTVGQNKNRGDTPLVCEERQEVKTYQSVTGALTPGAHPGSYNGQDAYNDMLVASANGFGGYSVGCGTLRAAGGDHGGGSEMLAVNAVVVRRLTPLECERLQGFPDGWTDIGEWTDSKGKKHKDADSPRYKALGNSIAVGYANNQSGFWCWLARRICAQYERRVTMASLFDGIGGFPLAFSACGAVPVWASEIEEFPIAVTKKHFPEEEEIDGRTRTD